MITVEIHLASCCHALISELVAKSSQKQITKSVYFTDYPATQKNILNITMTSQHARFQHEKKALIASNSRMKSWPISPSMSEDVRSRSSSYNSKFKRSSIKGLGANTQHSNTLIVSESVVILHIYIYILYIYIYINIHRIISIHRTSKRWFRYHFTNVVVIPAHYRLQMFVESIWAQLKIHHNSCTPKTPRASK